MPLQSDSQDMFFELESKGLSRPFRQQRLDSYDQIAKAFRLL